MQSLQPPVFSYLPAPDDGQNVFTVVVSDETLLRFHMRSASPSTSWLRFVDAANHPVRAPANVQLLRLSDINQLNGNGRYADLAVPLPEDACTDSYGDELYIMASQFEYALAVNGNQICVFKRVLEHRISVASGSGSGSVGVTMQKPGVSLNVPPHPPPLQLPADNAADWADPDYDEANYVVEIE